MNKMIFPGNDGLQAFIERLDKNHYDEISKLCKTTKKQSEKLQELEANQPASQYIATCITLTNEVENYILVKKEHLVPYVQTLYTKDTEGHDCSTCTGAGCNLKHEMQLTELRQSHLQLKDAIARLQMVSLPLYSDTIYPDIYRVLRSNMALLENNLAELFLLEETYLIPKIIEAQKNINARN